MAGLLRKKRIEEVVPSDEQGVIITSVFESDEEFGTDAEKKSVLKLEEVLIDQVSSDIEVDGHEMGEGQFIIYLYCPDADKSLPDIKSILDKSDFTWFNITLQYGPASDANVKEKIIRYKSKK